MAGRLRSAMLYLGLVDDEEQDYYDDEYDAPHDDDRALVQAGQHESHQGHTDSRRSRDDDEPLASPVAVRPHRGGTAQPPVAAVREASRIPASDPYRITTLTPRTYNEARTIGEHFREGVPVIINLTEMDDSDAKRLVDFAAGLIFGLRGSIERVTNKVFLLSPSNVEVSAEDKARIAQSGFFNQS